MHRTWWAVFEKLFDILLVPTLLVGFFVVLYYLRGPIAAIINNFFENEYPQSLTRAFIP